LRALIGVLSAAVLYLILGTGVMWQIKVGDLTFNPGNIVRQLSLLLGFAAGFLERLVPDLLEKKAAWAPGQQSAALLLACTTSWAG
jgi:hypothetical protein